MSKTNINKNSTKPLTVCKLCQRQRKLRNSHIISEFLYKPLYDPEMHRFHILSTLPAITKRFEQKGVREKLFCDDCEKLLCPYEDYVRRVLYGGVEIGIKDMNDLVLLINIDYKKFKLLQLSLLWRSSISSLPFFSYVKLGSRHEEKLRKMILSENPGEPHEYGCINFLILNDKKEMEDNLIMQPELVKMAGRHWYRFLCGGLLWFFFVSSHPPEPSYSDKFSLTKDGALRLFKKYLEDMDFLRMWARELVSKGKL